MGKLERITVTMPEEMARRLRAAVDSGEYATTSEIVREALRDWSDRQEADQRALDRLGTLIAAGDRGPSYPAEEVFAELRAIVAEEVRKHNAE